MRTFADVFKLDSTQNLVSKKDATEGVHETIKTTPVRIRVAQKELEYTYLNNATIFNSTNKLVQTIMAGKEVLEGGEKSLSALKKFLKGVGATTDLTWEELQPRLYQYAIIYGGIWIEKIHNELEDRIVDLALLDPKKMDYAKNKDNLIVLDKNQIPIGYVQKIPWGMSKEQLISRKAPEGVVLQNDEIFLPKEKIAFIKLFTVGDGFYPIGLIEPIYRTSIRKLNIEEGLANFIYSAGFPIRVGYVGDLNHEPNQDTSKNLLDKLHELNTKQNIVLPYYHKVEMLESKRSEKLQKSLDYFRDQEISGMGILKPITLGSGADTNRAAMAVLKDIYILTLKDIVERVCSGVRREIFKPVLELQGITEIPGYTRTGIGKNVEKLLELLAKLSRANIEMPEIQEKIKESLKEE